MLFFTKNLISIISNRLLNKYTTKSIGFFGVLWLVYASVANLSSDHAEFVSFAISNISAVEIKAALKLINYVIIFVLCFWLMYLCIDNLFRKSISEPTIIMMLFMKLTRINKDETSRGEHKAFVNKNDIINIKHKTKRKK